ncbi:MAG TPA: Crp/Fnr family transcriptional regulator [Xanthobacteraceae bacterium]|nr:Crp/Fnr family transcriptional regulator [Xanthobacteraceae bacterium]
MSDRGANVQSKSGNLAIGRGISIRSQQTSTAHTSRGLLSELPQHLLADLLERITPVRLRADEVLFLAGDAGDGCYRVEDGLLKVTIVSRGGSERILAFLGPGAIVGELSIIDGLPRSASVVAVRASVRSFLSRAAFEEFAGKHPEIYKSLVMLIAGRLRETDAALATGSFLPVKGRVACILLELAKDFGQDVGSDRVVIRQKIGQSDLAAMAGIARENVSRILNDWKRRKLVSRLSGYYCIENRAKLQTEAEL